jgi:hypothetical protein
MGRSMFDQGVSSNVLQLNPHPALRPIGSCDHWCRKVGKGSAGRPQTGGTDP